jgi:hypothetical protein
MRSGLPMTNATKHQLERAGERNGRLTPYIYNISNCLPNYVPPEYKRLNRRVRSQASQEHCGVLAWIAPRANMPA